MSTDMVRWVKCSDHMPASGVPVLAYVPDNGSGHSRRIRAAYAPAKTFLQDMDVEGGVYDEEKDLYWCEEGWYETNDYEECHWRVNHAVTHWMPLPAIPAEDMVQSAQLILKV